MKFLCENKFAPTTLGFGFLRADWGRVARGFKDWFSELNRHFEVRELNTSLDNMLWQLEPLRSSKDKHLVVKTRNDWVSYFGNGILGSDADPVISYLSRRIGCMGITFSCVPDRRRARLRSKARESYGSVCLQIFGPEEKELGNPTRVICAARDGARWVFNSRGERQFFEEPSYYEQKKIPNRFPPELLERYLVALGIDAFNKDFYENMGALFAVDTRDYPHPEALRPYTYQEIQAEMRWDIPD